MNRSNATVAWQTRILLAVEFLGRTLELALIALLMPVFVAAFRLGSFLSARFQALSKRAPRTLRSGPPSAAAVEPGSGVVEVTEVPEPTSAEVTQRPPAERPRLEPSPRWAWHAGLFYLLTVTTWVLLTMSRRVDAALQQMQIGVGSAGSASGFAVSWSDVTESLLAGAAQKTVDATREAWRAYNAEVAGRTVLRDPLEVAHQVVLLDLCFVVLYVVLMALVLLALRRINDGTRGSGDDEHSRLRRTRMLIGAGGCLGALFVVSLVEVWQLELALVRGRSLTTVGGVAVGPLMSLLKVPLAVGVIAPVVFVAFIVASRNRPLRRTLLSTRGALYALGGVLLVLNFGIGAAQADDVIRAWDTWRMVWAAVACVALSMTVAGVVNYLAGRAREHPAPDTGRDPQPLLLGAAVLLILIGQAIRWVGFGWGLSVAGALLAALWALGLPVADVPQWPAMPPPLRRRSRAIVTLVTAAVGALAGTVLALALEALSLGLLLGAVLGAVTALAALAGWSLAAGGLAVAPRRQAAAAEPVDPGMAAWGIRLGRFAGAAVAAVVVVTIARATALDAYVRQDPHWEIIGRPLAGAIIAGLGGLAVCILPRYRFWTAAWSWFTAVAFAGGIWLFQDANAITWAQGAGSISVLLGAFTLFLGGLALIAALIRRGPITQYALAPALRSLQFTRFPVLLFLAAWLLAVSVLDSGGYHNIRRLDRQSAAAPPTIGQAWQQYFEAVPAGGVRPVVIVAAQGGGMRAAVWTALVMECIFGPGPVAGSAGICAEGAASPDRARMADRAAEPLPVFLASGASGGSVGLAAWSARRADLIQDGSRSTTPRTVEEALDRDFVAPDVARLILADIPHAFLAWNRADRAAMLERAWEQPWRDGRPASDTARRGLTRGLRETWEVTHEDRSWSTPVLALNGANVEDGCRFLASAVDFTLPGQFPNDPALVDTAVAATDDRPDDAACRGVRGADATAVDILPSTNELIDYLCSNEDVPLSTAAHLSARFPYVSPTGRVERRPCADSRGLVPLPAVSYDADGGIFDNSGAGTAVDAWRALAPLVAATERRTGTCLVPIFLQIDNSPPAATVNAIVDSRPNELSAPISAILGQISSRDRYARAGAAAAFGQLVSASGQHVHAAGTDSLWFRVTLFGQPGPEPPLGWTLAPGTVNDMRSQLNADTNQQQIQTLRRLLQPGSLTCAP